MSTPHESFRDAVDRLEGRGDVDVSRNEMLADHTSLRIGGEASWWVEVGSREALVETVAAADAHDVPYWPVGLGSNVLFPDGGVDGAVIRLVDELAEWSFEEMGDEEAVVRVGGGVVNAHLVRGLLDAGWVGAEFLRLVPGTFGGAVAMNAGTKEAELESLLVDADLVVPDEGTAAETYAADELDLRYRHSDLPEGAVVVSGRVRVERGDVEEARRAMEADRERRDETQPYKLASAGSTFANPEDDYAGRLIDEAGLKGASVGGARISETHANFFINEDDATAEDFLRLMARARRRVRDEYGVELRPEVTFVGFDGMARLEEYERDAC